MAPTQKPEEPHLLGRHLDHRKEIDLSRRAPWRNCPGSGTGRSEAIFPHALEMDLDCLLDASQCYINGLPRCHAPRQIGHRGSPVTDWVFIDADQILTFSHGFSRLSLACRFTEASVPFGMSSPGFPLTVTRPGLSGCLNCR